MVTVSVYLVLYICYIVMAEGEAKEENMVFSSLKKKKWDPVRVDLTITKRWLHFSIGSHSHY